MNTKKVKKLCVRHLIFVTILLVLFPGCRSCLSEEEMDEVRMRQPFVNVELAFLDGEYRKTINGLWGNNIQSECSTYIKSGAIKTQDKTVYIQDPVVFFVGEKKVLEFNDNGLSYQLYISPNSLELISVEEWLTLIKINEKENTNG